MLVFRKELMNAFQRVTSERFVGAMEAHLIKNYPERFTDWTSLKIRKYIRRLMEQAISYGFVTERHVNLFIKLALHLGFVVGDEPLPESLSRLIKDETRDKDARLFDAIYRATTKKLSPN